MNRARNEEYDEKEAQARFEAALKSLAIPPVFDESELWLWLICAPVLKFIGRAPACAVPNACLCAKDRTPARRGD
jgi:hypothetical protein